MLGADIDLKDVDFDGVGSAYKAFRGVFDGNGYCIKNLKINKHNLSTIGLFRHCNNANIKNLTLENANITGKKNVGILIGDAENTKIQNVKVNGCVCGENVLGGLIGYSTNCDVEKTHVSGSVKTKLESNDVDNFFYF